MCRWLGATACALAMSALLVASAEARPSAPSFSWFSEGVPSVLARVPDPCCPYATAMALGAGGEVLARAGEGLGVLDSLGRMRMSPTPGGGEIVKLLPGTGGLWELRVTGEQSGDLLQLTGAAAGRRLTLGERPLAAAFGPNDSFWVMVGLDGLDGIGASAVVEVGSDGSRRSFALPGSPEGSGSIVVGADGNLWLTEQGAGPFEGPTPPTRIVRLSPSGQLASWTISASGERIYDLAATSDGVWFTLGSHEVGRIGYAGKIEVFSRGIPGGATPYGIVRGPDGAIWFTELRARAIGRVSRDGRIRQFAWGRSGPGPSKGGCAACLANGADSIVSGPGRTLWFSLPGRVEFGRLSVRPRCSVPRLLGYTVAAARRLLRAGGCRLGQVHAPSGEVIDRQGVAAGSLLAPGAPVGVGAVSPAAARRACVVGPDQRVVLADARVSLLAELQPEVAGTEGTPFTYLLCVRGGSGAHRVSQIEETAGGGQYSGAEPGLFALSGDQLAWQQRSSSYDMPFAELRTLDARAPGRSHAIPLTTPEAIPEQAKRLALNAAGQLGWLLEWGGTQPTDPQQAERVQVREASGVVTLEAGPAGSFGSLRMSRSGRLTWMRDGVTHAHQLAR